MDFGKYNDTRNANRRPENAIAETRVLVNYNRIPYPELLGGESEPRLDDANNEMNCPNIIHMHTNFQHDIRRFIN